MEEKAQIFKSDLRTRRLPSCVTDLSYFKKLYDILKEVSDEAIEYEISNLNPKNFKSDEDFENAKKNAKDLMKINVQIRGSKGEYFLSQDKSVFEESSLPNSITFISFDNSSLYRYALNAEPINSFLIEFDFSKTSIFDFSNSPSKETLNNSTIKVLGQNKTWVQGSYERILDTLDGLTTKRSWLHKSNIYDLFLWLLVMPITFLNIYKLELSFKDMFINVPSIFIVALHLYIFILILYLFMIFFRYTRWLFPYMELKESLKNTAALHRSVFFIILLGVTANIISLLITYLF